MTTLPYEPESVRHLLAKSADRGLDGKEETLAHHTWAVLEKLADFIRLRPDLPVTLGQPRLWHLLYWATFLHDFGKAARGFQARLASKTAPVWPYRHEVLSLAFVDWVAAGLSDEETMAIAAAIVSHHKDADRIRQSYGPVERGEPDPVEELFHDEIDKTTIRALFRWLATEGILWRDTLGLAESGIDPLALPDEATAVARIATQGGKRVSFWLRRYYHLLQKLDPHHQRPWVHTLLVLRGMLINSDHLGSGHYGPLPHLLLDADAILASRGLTWAGLYDHQRDSAVVDGSALLEAPTGTGKTEAALLWAAQQGRGRLFYTLPYQASMNAMQGRLAGSFGEELVGLQHGRSLLALYRQKLQDDPTPQNAARAARIARDLAKLNHPPIRIFSPYQMLKAPYRLRGYEAQLADYHQAAFIFDEIHAYEPERLALILETIRFLATHFHARFFVMSATFPAIVKQRLEEVLGGVPSIRATDDLFSEFQRHTLHLLDGEMGDSPNQQRIFAEAEGGRAVLAVCNTVKGAQALYRAAEVALPHTRRLLLHGRFNGEDRLKKSSRSAISPMPHGNSANRCCS